MVARTDPRLDDRTAQKKAPSAKDVLTGALLGAAIAAAVAAVVWAVVPVVVEMLLMGKRWPPLGTLLPMALACFVLGLCVAAVATLTERLFGAGEPSDLRALMVGGFVLGAGALTVRLLGGWLDRLPSASTAERVADPTTGALLAAAVALPLAVTTFCRLTRVSVGGQLAATAILGNAGLMLAWAAVGTDAVGPFVTPFVLALMQPGVLALADIAERKMRAEEPRRAERRRRPVRIPRRSERLRRAAARKKKGDASAEPRHWGNMAQASTTRAWHWGGMPF